jgi:hypothetical protein
MQSWFGVNPANVVDYSGACETKDCMLLARPPEAIAGGFKRVIFTDGPLELNGDYTIYLRGSANVGLTGGSPADMLPGPLQDGWRTWIARVRAKSGQTAQLHLSFTGGDVNEVHVLRPGYTIDSLAAGPFTDQYVSAVGWGGHARSMSWIGINGATVKTYAELSEESDVTWAPRDGTWNPDNEPDWGAPWKAFPRLCRQAGVRPWANVPADMDDAGSHQMALDVAESLEGSDLDCYLEYANEWWNRDSRFTQWNRWKADPAKFGADLLRHARIWRGVLGDRVSIVAGGHINNSAVLRGVATFLQSQNALKEIQYGAVTGYFGSAANDVAGIRASALAIWHGTQADKYFATLRDAGWGSCVYEGGASGGDDAGGNFAARQAAHNDPAMEQVVADGLMDFRNASTAAGVTPGPWTYFLLSNIEKKSLYGLTPTVLRPDTPKAKGFRAAVAAAPRPAYDDRGALRKRVGELQDQLQGTQAALAATKAERDALGADVEQRKLMDADRLRQLDALRATFGTN